MAKKRAYKIGEACRLLDIQPYVLRYWEKEFPFLKPEKSRSGQRVYSAQEIAIIRRIKALLYDDGYTIAGAKKKLEAELAAHGGTLPEIADGEAAEAPSDEAADAGPSAERAANDDTAAAQEAPALDSADQHDTQPVTTVDASAIEPEDDDAATRWAHVRAELDGLVADAEALVAQLTPADAKR
ncbi:MAG: MerR family transcriptional regulator [Acidobacteriota bacterium]